MQKQSAGCAGYPAIATPSGQPASAPPYAQAPPTAHMAAPPASKGDAYPSAAPPYAQQPPYAGADATGASSSAVPPVHDQNQGMFGKMAAAYQQE
jgi:hypothetical protein